MLNQSHTSVRSAAPLLSEYWNVNVCCSPLPDAGVTDTAVVPAAGTGTVQVPRACQLLDPDGLVACM